MYLFNFNTFLDFINNINMKYALVCIFQLFYIYHEAYKNKLEKNYYCLINMLSFIRLYFYLIFLKKKNNLTVNDESFNLFFCLVSHEACMYIITEDAHIKSIRTCM